MRKNDINYSLSNSLFINLGGSIDFVLFRGIISKSECGSVVGAKRLNQTIGIHNAFKINIEPM